MFSSCATWQVISENGKAVEFYLFIFHISVAVYESERLIQMQGIIYKSKNYKKKSDGRT